MLGINVHRWILYASKLIESNWVHWILYIMWQSMKSFKNLKKCAMLCYFLVEFVHRDADMLIATAAYLSVR